MTMSFLPRTRDQSPLPNISIALFSSDNITCHQATATVTTPAKKRTSRPSLEDDLKRDMADNKENLDPVLSRRLSMKCSKTCQEDNSVTAEVFQYPSPRELPPHKFSKPISIPLPRVSIQAEDDDVFDGSCITGMCPPSSKICLTPSTARTPLIRCSSSSSQYLSSSLIPSPNIDRGLCCSTPNRMKLESEGLSSTEKMILGRGAYGTVVLGKWKGKKVAIKVMEKEEGGRTVRRRKSLESELQAKQLEHKNIVQVFDVYAKDNQYAVIIMEYVGSRNLHRLLIESKDKYLDPSLLLTAALHVSSALQHCHCRGIIHLDVKPSNVLVNSQGVFKLGDFGCSVSTSKPGLEVDHSLVGTPGYQAPEFLRGSVPSPACDIYSLAILLWQLDSREIPFSGHHPQAVMYQVVAAGVRPRPPVPSHAYVNINQFTSLYQSCWEKNPGDRPTSKDIVKSLLQIKFNHEQKLNRKLVTKSVVSSKKLMRL